MPLLTIQETKELLNLHNLPNSIGSFIVKSFLKVTKIDIMNKVYDKHKHLSCLPYLNALLNEFKIKYHVPTVDLDKIPESGPFIIVSNHPLGGIDGVILLKSLLEKRSDFKIIANYLLCKQEPVAPYIFPVNPFEGDKMDASSLRGTITALKHLKLGKPIGIFPAGEVSTISENNIYIDKEWEDGAMRIIQKAGVPVIPVYFKAKNSSFFYLLNRISPTLRTLRLPGELLNKKNQVIKMFIGDVIDLKKNEKIDTIDHLKFFLRYRTYVLSKSENDNFSALNKVLGAFKLKPKKIAAGKKQHLVIQEIEKLEQQKKRLYTQGEYGVFLTKSDHIPNLMHEIARLREITFREIGEGTNKGLDTDIYDDYYQHLILWNYKNSEFVGAYRLGFGKEIYEKIGVEGFYVSKFFEFDKKIHEKLPLTIEMGRAFIVPKYQKKMLPLFLLWRGIALLTLKMKDYQYLMGGATISNLFTDYSMSMLLYFLNENFSNNEIKPLVKAKQPYEIKLSEDDKKYATLFIGKKKKKLDELISCVEQGRLKVPVLIKQYLKQNAEFVAYNVDENFNDAVDALIFMKMANIPKKTIEPLLKDVTLDDFELEVK